MNNSVQVVPIKPTFSHKNWREICKIEDQSFRIFLCSCEDENILKGVEQSFPEFFTKDRVANPFVPVSVICDAAERFSWVKWCRSEDYNEVITMRDREFIWLNVLGDFSIPVAYFFAMGDDLRVPESICEQFVGQKLDSTMRIKYKGGTYVVCWLFSEFGLAENFRKVITLKPNQKKLKIEELALVDVRFINYEL